MSIPDIAAWTLAVASLFAAWNAVQTRNVVDALAAWLLAAVVFSGLLVAYAVLVGGGLR